MPTSTSKEESFLFFKRESNITLYGDFFYSPRVLIVGWILFLITKKLQLPNQLYFPIKESFYNSYSREDYFQLNKSFGHIQQYRWKDRHFVCPLIPTESKVIDV